MEFHGISWNFILTPGFSHTKRCGKSPWGVSPFGFHDLQMVGGCYWSRSCTHGMEFKRILVGGIPTIVVNILLIMLNINGYYMVNDG